MTATPEPPLVTHPTPVADGLALRPSSQLERIPAERPSVVSASARPASSAGPATAPPLWLLLGLAAVASAGWLLERRRRRELETEKDSVLWAHVQPRASSITTDVEGSEIASGDTPALPAPQDRPTTAGARREATLSDLHELDGRLRRRRASGDLLSAVLLLQQHIAEFRVTSPWVFLELRELYHLLDRERDWELAREVFQGRFGQRAPLWQAPSTAGAGLEGDVAIVDEIATHWPYREARLAMLRWIFGEPEVPGQPSHHPVLALGVYRELLFLDRLLDEVLIARPPVVDSLLL